MFATISAWRDVYYWEKYSETILTFHLQQSLSSSWRSTSIPFHELDSLRHLSKRNSGQSIPTRSFISLLDRLRVCFHSSNSHLPSIPLLWTSRRGRLCYRLHFPFCRRTYESYKVSIHKKEPPANESLFSFLAVSTPDDSDRRKPTLNSWIVSQHRWSSTTGTSRFPRVTCSKVVFLKSTSVLVSVAVAPEHTFLAV